MGIGICSEEALDEADRRHHRRAVAIVGAGTTADERCMATRRAREAGLGRTLTLC